MTKSASGTRAAAAMKMSTPLSAIVRLFRCATVRTILCLRSIPPGFQNSGSYPVGRYSTVLPSIPAFLMASILSEGATTTILSAFLRAYLAETRVGSEYWKAPYLSSGTLATSYPPETKMLFRPRLLPIAVRTAECTSANQQKVRSQLATARTLL